MGAAALVTLIGFVASSFSKQNCVSSMLCVSSLFLLIYLNSVQGPTNQPFIKANYPHHEGKFYFENFSNTSNTVCSYSMCNSLGGLTSCIILNNISVYAPYYIYHHNRCFVGARYLGMGRQRRPSKFRQDFYLYFDLS